MGYYEHIGTRINQLVKSSSIDYEKRVPRSTGLLEPGCDIYLVCDDARRMRTRRIAAVSCRINGQQDHNLLFR